MFEHCELCGHKAEQLYNKMPPNWRRCMRCKKIWSNFFGFTMQFHEENSLAQPAATHSPIPDLPLITDDELIDLHTFLAGFERPLPDLFVKEQPNVQS